jgi:hypothetical protein
MPSGVYKRTPEHNAAIGRSVKATAMRGKKPGWFHGTANGYGNHKCRCADCTKAWADYLRGRNQAKAAIKRELASS